MARIKIGKQDVEMVANAATPILFKIVFKEDFFVVSQKVEEEEGLSVDLFSKVGYVMAMQAKKKLPQLLKLTLEDYIEWMAQFETLDVALSVSEIADIYAGNTKTTSTPKK